MSWLALCGPLSVATPFTKGRPPTTNCGVGDGSSRIGSANCVLPMMMAPVASFGTTTTEA